MSTARILQVSRRRPKRKAVIAIDSRADPFTNSIKSYKSNEALSIASDLVGAHLSNNATLPKSAMVEVMKALDHASVNGKAVSKILCPGGGDTEWQMG